MSDEKITIDGFGDVEMDAIGEIMNITMGSAATAVSNMLSAKVWITTPTVNVIESKEINFPELEPSIMVKIKYTQGISGQNVLVLKQNDVQLILNQLMGLPLEISEDFQFDELNISAVCEVMNQMMGASATALSEIIETTVDISTPEAIVQEGDGDVKTEIYELAGQDYVCTVKFDLTIDGVIKSEFISVLTIDLAKEMASKMMATYN
ncbi:MAG: flagellar motor switch phosphatase FliY, partial [Ruminococcus sp.]|nr:flagellar motor switch phosphatase FliY [Ruminococcus sp.]